MQDLTGKVAVITGGASGIGLAMAEAFGREGMKLAIADIQQDALDKAVPWLRGQGLEVIGVRCDVSKYVEVEALRDAVLAEFKAVHLVVNNAGVSITGPTWEMSLDDWRWIYDVNLWGVIHGIKAFTPTLLAQGGQAHIVNIASEAGFNGIGEHAPYCSSKAAVVSISQSLRSELIYVDAKIGVSVVCPGMVSTDIHRSWRNRPQADQPWSDREWNDPARRAGTDAFQAKGVAPEVIAEATLDAVKTDRFYVFSGENWPRYLNWSLCPILKGENPAPYSWSPDLRPRAGDQPASPRLSNSAA